MLSLAAVSLLHVVKYQEISTLPYRTTFIYCLIGSLLAYSLDGLAKDAFGLDQFKVPTQALTGSISSYNTRLGNQISVYAIKNSPGKTNPKNSQRFLIQGGLHGNELLTSEFVTWLAQRFARGESMLNSLNNGSVEIDFVPYANPDGTVLYSRYNAEKINLNRNFGVLWGTTKENPGPSAFSENETRAIRDLLLNRNYTGSIDIHGYINWIVLPTSPKDGFKDIELRSTSKESSYLKWAEAVSKETQKHLPGYEIKTSGGLGDGGAFEDFAWWGANVPAACLEIFSKERFLARSIAASFVDILTPKSFKLSDNFIGQEDMFLIYENYIHSLFVQAIKIKSGNPDPQNIAERKK